jgi:predicted  nucleic acid-binding Zn-ribbon protein
MYVKKTLDPIEELRQEVARLAIRLNSEQQRVTSLQTRIVNLEKRLTDKRLQKHELYLNGHDFE